MISKTESFELLTLISDFYDQFEISQSRIDSWHMAIKDYELEKLKENLLHYCRENKYPPKVADLIKEKSKIHDRMNAIPDAKETRRLYLQPLPRKEDYTEEEKLLVEKYKLEIRKILGIG